MKQFTTPKQTAKLIELGFEPSTRIPFEVGNDELGRTFSIGELIEMLPKKVTNRAGRTAILQMTCYQGVWRVKYAGAPDMWLTMNEELIDALYDTLVEVKTNAKEYGYEL